MPMGGEAANVHLSPTGRVTEQRRKIYGSFSSVYALIAGDVLTSFPYRSFSYGARFVRNQVDQAGRLYRDLSWPAHFHRGSGSTRTTGCEVYVRTQPPMGCGRFPTMECGALYQSFLPAECQAGVAQGANRVCRVARYRSWGGNNLRLWPRIF